MLLKNATGFHQQTQKFELHYMSLLSTLGVKGLRHFLSYLSIRAIILLDVTARQSSGAQVTGQTC